MERAGTAPRLAPPVLRVGTEPRLTPPVLRVGADRVVEAGVRVGVVVRAAPPLVRDGGLPTPLRVGVEFRVGPLDAPPPLRVVARVGARAVDGAVVRVGVRATGVPPERAGLVVRVAGVLTVPELGRAGDRVVVGTLFTPADGLVGLAELTPPPVDERGGLTAPPEGSRAGLDVEGVRAGAGADGRRVVGVLPPAVLGRTAPALPAAPERVVGVARRSAAPPLRVVGTAPRVEGVAPRDGTDVRVLGADTRSVAPS